VGATWEGEDAAESAADTWEEARLPVEEVRRP
jgi:hypothetical protein